jgi:hypothetical protein
MRVPTAAASVLHHAHGHREPDTDELDCHGCARGEVDPVVPAAGARRRVRTQPPLVRARGTSTQPPPPRARSSELHPGRRGRARACSNPDAAAAGARKRGTRLSLSIPHEIEASHKPHQFHV